MAQATGNKTGQKGVADQASEKAQEAVDVAQEKAAELKDEGSMKLRDQFDQRSNEAGSQIRSVAQALRRSGDDLRTEGNTTAAHWTGQAADRLEQLGNYLEQKRGDDFIHDIEGFARRRPWMLAGIGMLAGIAAARFMKASSENRYDSYQRTSSPQPALGPGYGEPLDETGYVSGRGAAVASGQYVE